MKYQYKKCIPEIYKYSNTGIPEIYKYSNTSVPEIYKYSNTSIPEIYKYSNTSIPEIYKNLFRFLVSCLNKMYLLLLLKKKIVPFIVTNYKIEEQKYFLMNI